MKWEDIVAYLRDTCVDLPYRIQIERVGREGASEEHIAPKPLKAEISPELEPLAVRVPVCDEDLGLEGEITLFDFWAVKTLDEGRSTSIEIAEDEKLAVRNRYPEHGSLLTRGGFRVGSVPGMPSPLHGSAAATVRLKWQRRHRSEFLPVNIARNRPADSDRIGESIARHWISFLLDNSLNLPSGCFYGLWIRDSKVESMGWLEKYDALHLYNAAKIGWSFDFRDRGMLDFITRWESGAETRLKIRHGDLCDRILWIVLPKVCSLQVGPFHKYVMPPAPDWENQLRAWHNFISQPVSWGPFAEYAGGIGELLFYKDISEDVFLNSRYTDHLSVLEGPEYRILTTALTKLVEARHRSRQPKLDQTEAAVLQKVWERVCSFSLGASYANETWPLSSFTW